jgi:acyl carrier protein
MVDRVKKVISQIFGVRSVPDDLKINDIEQWSSLGQIQLMLGIEEEFGINIPTEKLLDLTSVAKIDDYLTKEVRDKTG